MTANEPDTGTSTVCIPWRPQPDRIAAHNRVTTWWRDHGFTIIQGDTNHDRFNLSAARNAAARQATTPVVIIADADTIPQPQPLQQAIDIARQTHTVVYPFTDYRYLPPEAVNTDDLETVQPERIYRASVGGLIVAPRTLYWELGGMDEGFRQWGYEDNAFQLAAETLATITRIPGTVYSFSHTADRDMTRSNPGRMRMELYRYAARYPAVMRELVYRC